MAHEQVKTLIVLFDGDCILCNKAVQFIIRRDPSNIFKFASLQSDYGKSIINNIGRNTADLNSIVLIENNNYYFKSAAVKNILKELRGYALLYRVLDVIPNFILDCLYSFTAKIRYRLFGKTDNCIIYQSEDFSKRVIE
ncbi:MAG: thiol-disulfide oxidoreductase DCC family protein [Bacteroidota bacterium]